MLLKSYTFCCGLATRAFTGLSFGPGLDQGPFAAHEVAVFRVYAVSRYRLVLKTLYDTR
jgi:hypothetical protein